MKSVACKAAGDWLTVASEPQEATFMIFAPGPNRCIRAGLNGARSCGVPRMEYLETKYRCPWKPVAEGPTRGIVFRRPIALTGSQLKGLHVHHSSDRLDRARDLRRDLESARKLHFDARAFGEARRPAPLTMSRDGDTIRSCISRF